MMFLPRLGVDVRRELLRCPSHSGEGALDSRKRICTAIWAAKEPISKSGHAHRGDSTRYHESPLSKPPLRFLWSDVLDE
jgi:hypothetical protein